MVEITISDRRLDIVSTDFVADADIFEQIEQNYNHLVNFIQVHEALRVSGAFAYSMHASSFNEIIIELWLYGFNLILLTFDSLADEMYYTHMRSRFIWNSANNITDHCITPIIPITAREYNAKTRKTDFYRF